ncbi:hypothetical protein [Pseudorhodoplanes sp.]|uniref:hypothetical protein n=1 Tax=Pseudorhodoplanes sp. TaxID=1934341 RepID=UPI003D140EA9
MPDIWVKVDIDLLLGASPATDFTSNLHQQQGGVNYTVWFQPRTSWQDYGSLRVNYGHIPISNTDPLFPRGNPVPVLGGEEWFLYWTGIIAGATDNHADTLGTIPDESSNGFTHPDYLWRHVLLPDEAEDEVQISVADETATEDSGVLKFQVTATGIASGSVTLQAGINLQPDQLRFSSATIPLADFTFAPNQTVTLTKDNPTGYFSVTLLDDSLIEADEKFSLSIEHIGNTTTQQINLVDAHAVGTIANGDDGPALDTAGVTFLPWTGLSFSGLSLHDTSLIKTYVQDDLMACVLRVEAALDINLPDFKIQIVGKTQEGSILASAAASYSKTIVPADKKFGSYIDVPDLLWSLRNAGQDANLNEPDMYIYLDPNKLKDFYSGDFLYDTTSIMLHEFAHGLGVGSSGVLFSNTPFEAMTKKVGDSFYFTGAEAKKISKKGALLDPNDKYHLDPSTHDLFDTYGAGMPPGKTLSEMDVAILKDLGYTAKVPKWWSKEKKKKDKDVDQSMDRKQFDGGSDSDALQFATVWDHDWIV